MPDTGVYAFSIRKSTAWRGGTQGFSNIYHYFLTTPTEAALQNVLTALKAAEVPVHATNVTFVEGRAWGPVQTNGKGGRMEAFVAFSGAGSAAPNAGFYKEAAYLVYWPLGRYGVKNRPQFMRKWIHSQASVMSVNSGFDGNTDLGGLSTPGTNYINAVTNLTPTGGGPTLPMQTPSGHTPTSAGQLYKYLEHHQFGR